MISRFKKRHGLTVAALALGAFAGVAQADIETYTAVLSGAEEVPPNESPATGTCELVVDTATLEATWYLEFSGLTAAQTGAHFHTAPAGANGPVVFGLPLGSPVNGTWSMLQADYDLLAAGDIYVNVHTAGYPGGEIRGQMALESVGTEATTLDAMKALFR